VQRVLVIGISGAGKSTFSRELGALTGLPVVHLDAEFWQPSWVAPPRARWLRRVDELICEPRWIMDGNYGATLPTRLARADTLIWFDYPRHVALRRVIARLVRWRGQVRPDTAGGCPERFDVDFLRWIWDFVRVERPRLAAIVAGAGPHVATYIFRRDGEKRRFMTEIATRTRHS
jgi:adenylate kinase family enzyme